MTIDFDATSLAELSERTEYEAWLLEAIYALVENELFHSYSDGVVYPLHKSSAYFYAYGRVNCGIGDWRPGFLDVGAPLVFVATFKILDMLLEWVLAGNGHQPSHRFNQKIEHLSGSPVFPQLIESRSWLKERLIALYRTIEPLRGTIVHDKHFSVTNGALQVASSKKGSKARQ